MRIVFGSDHAGFQLRRRLVAVAQAFGHEVIEVGAQSEAPFDYPIAADDACAKLLQGEADRAVLVCGTGIGMAIRANRHIGIRAANCTTPDMAKISRAHNHINVLCLGERTTSAEVAVQVFDVFLSAPEDKHERHVRRVGLLDRNV